MVRGCPLHQFGLVRDSPSELSLVVPQCGGLDQRHGVPQLGGDRGIGHRALPQRPPTGGNHGAERWVFPGLAVPAGSGVESGCGSGLGGSKQVFEVSCIGVLHPAAQRKIFSDFWTLDPATLQNITRG